MDIQWGKKKLVWLAGFITAMVCLTRISMAAGSVFNGCALLTGLLLYYKNRESFFLSEEAKGYIRAFAIFALSTIPSIIFSQHPGIGMREFLNMWVWRFIVFILVLGFLKRRDYLETMLMAFLFVFGVDCFVAMGQVVLFQVSSYNRGWGFGSNVLTIAGVMCMVLPLALVILMDTRFTKRLKQISAFAVVAVCLGLLANKSRGAWLTEIIIVPVAVGYYVRKNLKYAIVFLLLAGVFIGYMATEPAYARRFNSITNITTDYSNADRIWAWRSAKNMIADHPAFGVGLGQFREHYIANYKYKQETQNLVHSHNNFVQITAECGVVGLLGLLYFIGYFLYHSFCNWKKQKDPYDILIFTTVLGFLCLFGQIEYTLDNSSGMRIFWFLIALLLQLKTTEHTDMRSEHS